MGLFNRIVEQLYRSTGLSPVPSYKPVPVDDFIAHFSSESLNFSPEKMKVPTVISNTFASGIEALRKINHLPEAILETANNLGLKMTRLILPTGQDISVVRDSSGNEMDGAKIGMSTSVVRQALGVKATNLQERQAANELKMSYRLKNEKNSAEYAAFNDYLNPFNKDGKVRAGAQFGWDGLFQNIRSLPVPDGVRHDAIMDMVVSGNTAYMGVSVMKAHATQTSSLKAMLATALDMDMKIPARADGTPWNMDSPIDREAAIALCGTKDSPFVAGGKPLLTEGTAILLNDSHLVRLNALSSELTPNKINERMIDIGNGLRQECRDMIANAATPEQKNSAENRLGALEARNTNYTSYEDSMSQRHRDNVEMRRKASEERQRSEAERQKNKSAPHHSGENVYSLFTGQDAVAEAAPVIVAPNKIGSLSYSEIKERLPDWEPTHHNVSFSMDEGVMGVELYIDDATQKRMNVLISNPKISDISGFEIEDLKAGSYPVHGADDAFINVVKEDGRKQRFVIGLDEESEVSPAVPQPSQTKRAPQPGALEMAL